MSLLSAIILPKLESEFIALEPVLAAFMIKQIRTVAEDIIKWAETKIEDDLNGNSQKDLNG